MGLEIDRRTELQLLLTVCMSFLTYALEGFEEDGEMGPIEMCCPICKAFIYEIIYEIA